MVLDCTLGVVAKQENWGWERRSPLTMSMFRHRPLSPFTNARRVVYSRTFNVEHDTVWRYRMKAMCTRGSIPMAARSSWRPDLKSKKEKMSMFLPSYQ